MFEKYTDFRETQQLRKDQKQLRKIQYAFVLIAILGTLLLALVAIEEMSPPAKSAPAVASVKQTETQEIQEFATAVMKPLAKLTDEDLAVVEAKADDPCYAKNAELPYELMVKNIKECKLVKE